MQFKDIVGLIEEGGDSVSTKKRIQRGEWMIFADSSYYITIADTKDQWYEKALELSKYIENSIRCEIHKDGLSEPDGDIPNDPNSR